MIIYMARTLGLLQQTDPDKVNEIIGNSKMITAESKEPYFIIKETEEDYGKE